MMWQDVVNGRSPYSVQEADAFLFLRDLPNDSVNFVFGSPPYLKKMNRYDGVTKAQVTLSGWVEWMLQITTEAVRVCSGDVMWVVNGPVDKGQYHPAVEGLIWKWHERGGICERSVIWSKNAPPNRKDWYGNGHEFVVCFKKSTKPREYFNWEAVAEPPKFKSGGRFRQRTSNGTRRLGNEYPKNKLARPRDVVRATVGGGQMGSKLASLNEAPFPESLVKYFVPVLCPPGGITLDCFSGSGAVGKVALNLGRKFIGCDNRASQVELSLRRIHDEVSAELRGDVSTKVA